MTQDALFNIIVGVVAVAWLVNRQLSERPVKEKNSYLLMAILALFGAYQIVQYVGVQPLNSLVFGILGLSLVLGVVFGVLRGATTHLWRDKGVLVRKGNWITILLWVVGIGLHIASDSWMKAIDVHAASLGSVTLLLYIALSLGAQRFTLLQRSEVALEKDLYLAQRKKRK